MSLTNGNINVNVGGNDCEKLFHITFDQSPTFNNYISGLCKKNGWNLSALTKIIL